MKIEVTRQRSQQFQIQWRERGYADDADPLRQMARIEIAALQAVAKARLRPNSMQGLATLREPPPQLGLPMLFLPGFPRQIQSGRYTRY